MSYYQPIDYTPWNFDGQGKNIINLLLPIERDIWKTALPLQDKRDDLGHAETVTYFALKLLEHLNTERQIVVPTAILHDVGWSQLSQTERDLFKDPNMKRYDSILRARHQEEGVKVAQKILQKNNYKQANLQEISEIISEHDTRKGFLSQNDGLVRDADKLWRFTVTEFVINIFYRGKTAEYLHEKRLKDLEKSGFFYSDISKEIARIELENTLSNSHFYTKKQKS